LKVLLYRQAEANAFFQQCTGFVIVASRKLTRKLLKAFKESWQANLVVGPKHWAPSPHGPSIAIHVDNIDITRLLRNALLQNFESLVDQWKQDAFQDFLASQGTFRFVHYIALNELRNLWRWNGRSPLAELELIVVPTLFNIKYAEKVLATRWAQKRK
jgi:hypothetical protein